MTDHAHPPDLATYWEQRYADTERVWSGRVNRALADVASSLQPGTALDLGCGEGGDAVWLASQGWRVLGVDISPSAAERGRVAAEAQGIPADRIRFEAADLDTWSTDERFDLVTSAFFQSWPIEMPRADILRRAAERVAPGGHVLVIAHATPPRGHAHEGETPPARLFPSPESERADLGLDDAELWELLIAEVRDREVTGPDGRPMTIGDSIVLARRR